MKRYHSEHRMFLSPTYLSMVRLRFRKARRLDIRGIPAEPFVPFYLSAIAQVIHLTDDPVLQELGHASSGRHIIPPSRGLIEHSLSFRLLTRSQPREGVILRKMLEHERTTVGARQLASINNDGSSILPAESLVGLGHN